MAWSQDSCSDDRVYADYDDLCEDCQDCCGDNAYEDCCSGCQECGCKGRGDQAAQYEKKWSVKHNTNNTKMGETHMNRTIAKLFEKTADAMLVNKFYGHQIQDNDVEYIRLNGKQKELLASAQALQDKQDAHAHVVTAKVVA